MRASRAAIPAVLAASVGACSPTGNEIRTEFMPAPAMERTLAQAGVRQTNAWPQSEWWRQFRSAELDRLMAKALADNQDLKKIRDRLQEAEALAQVEGARIFPTLDSDWGMRQSRIPSHGVVASYNPDIAGQEKTMAYINPVQARYETDFWGKNRAAFDAALGERAAEEAELAETRLLLTSAVARAYFRGLAAARQVELAREMTRSKRELVELAETRFRTGIDTQDPIPLARMEFENAKKREAGVTALLGLQQDLVARLIGEGPDAGRGLFAKGHTALPAAPALPKTLPIELPRVSDKREAIDLSVDRFVT